MITLQAKDMSVYKGSISTLKDGRFMVQIDLGKDENGKYTVPDMKGYVPIGATDDDIDDAIDGNSFYNK